MTKQDIINDVSTSTGLTKLETEIMKEVIAKINKNLNYIFRKDINNFIQSM